MDNTKNLDDYLAGLGISEPGEAVLPAPPQPLPPDEARTAEAGDAELGPGEVSTAESGGQGGAALWSMPGTLGAQETLELFLGGLLSRVDPEL